MAPRERESRGHHDPGSDPSHHDHQATSPEAVVMVPRRTGSMVGRTYLDGGDRLSGRFSSPRLVTVLARWGPGGGPRNVLVQYADDGHQAVVPFPRRLRRADTSTAEAPPEPPATDKAKLSGNCARCTRRDRDRRRRQATRETPEIGTRLRAQVQALGRRIGEVAGDGLAGDGLVASLAQPSPYQPPPPPRR